MSPIKLQGYFSKQNSTTQVAIWVRRKKTSQSEMQSLMTTSGLSKGQTSHYNPGTCSTIPYSNLLETFIQPCFTGQSFESSVQCFTVAEISY